MASLLVNIVFIISNIVLLLVEISSRSTLDYHGEFLKNIVMTE